MLTPKDIMEFWANNYPAGCLTNSKCGQCLKNQIRSEVSREFIQKEKTTQDYIVDLYIEVDNRWHKSDFYRFFLELKDSGMDAHQILNTLGSLGSLGYIP